MIRIELWCKDNSMFINCNKAKCMTVGTRQKLAFQNKELYPAISTFAVQICYTNFFFALFVLDE